MKPWLTLFRAPNAFTVPGDAVAGWFLAGAIAPGKLPLLVASSLGLYLGGLALNDWFDRHVDARERPDRPIPSGAIPAGAALAAGAILLAAGVGLAALAGPASALIAAGIAGLVVLYDGPARKVPGLAFLVMGLCRGLDVMLGASLVLPEVPWAAVAAAVLATLYITAVTAAAKEETEGPPRGLYRWAPLLVLLFGLPAVPMLATPSTVAVAACAVAVVPVAIVVFSFTGDLPAAAVPPRIGRLIRALIPLQGAFVLAAAPAALLSAAAIYVLWPLARVTGRWFYGS